MKRVKVLVLELILVLAGVFVFRGLWTLLDRWPAMNEPAALWVSLVLGTCATVWSLNALITHKA